MRHPRKRKPHAEFRKPMREKLTVERLESLRDKPPSQRTDYWDIYCPGLTARVSPRGRITFNVLGRTRTPGGARRAIRFRVGLYPRIGLKEARSRAIAALLLLEEGLDPRFVQQTEREAKHAQAEKARTNTFGSALSDYALKKMIGPDPAKPLKGAYGAETIRDLEREFADDFLPMREVKDPVSGAVTREIRPVRAGLRNVPLTMLEWRHIDSRLTDALWRGAESRAFHLFAACRGFLNWCCDPTRRKQYGVTENIFAGVTAETAINRERKKGKRTLSDMELSLVWRALTQVGGHVEQIGKLLLLTGSRRSDVTEARGREFDLSKQEWIIPSDRYKTGDAMFVPLSAQALELLRGMSFVGTDKFVCTTTAGAKAFSGHSKMKVEVDKTIAQLNGGEPIADWKIHDLRRTVRTRLAQMGISDEIGEAVIGHRPKSLISVYRIWDYAPEKKLALQKWADELERIVSSTP